MESSKPHHTPPPQTRREKIVDWLICYLSCDIEPIPLVPLSDFAQVQQKIQPGDVLLIEGRSRVSRVISTITKSAWTHAALYLGCLKDMASNQLKATIKKHYQGADTTPLVLESRLDAGVIILPLTAYQSEHIRICRPKGISDEQKQRVLFYALERVGFSYDHQHIFDLARFLFPWFLLPKRWRSSLFRYQAGHSTKITCSLLLAEAFMSIRYPILPFVRQRKTGGYEFIRRNPKLFTPRDFDYSPYFEVIKCPVVEFSENTPYTAIPWNEGWISHDGEGVCKATDTKAKSDTGEFPQ